MKKLFLLAIVMSTLSACNIEKKKEGELPSIDVDVDTEAGELPEYDVKWADVNVGTTTKTVEVPKVVIVMEEEEVEVPYIDVDMPDNKFGDKEERTLMIEAEVSDYEHDIEIEEIFASKNTLHVIAKLEKSDTSLDDKKMRISDQVTLNAPDLNVKYYIVGERPDRVFNSRYKYITSIEDLKSKIDDYTVIYN
ncbi:hypothetical protein HME9304_00183 [Flagellimonas maritima]|uniref:Uncharacterized protein n=1 Tax=Flagellimonas maritima TaxID=1383885 RepID=A0A2Z4LN53_9FLAO|nr:hypothetical protein [Allomuricauda aurantiaca]AWX43196.1 hypothetical protein HME9304_00183 [Allomuricauda aurantiaca]